MRAAAIRAPRHLQAGAAARGRRGMPFRFLSIAAALLATASVASAAPTAKRSSGADASAPDRTTATAKAEHKDARTSSHASTQAIAILSLELTGDAAPELKPQLERSLRAGLEGHGARVIRLATVMGAIGDKPELLGCTSTTCLSRIGAIVGAHRFVAATIAADGAAYTIELQLLSPDVNGGLARHLKSTCTVCTLSDLHARVKSTAAALISPAREPVAVVITTQPPQATLTVDGAPAGRAPYRGQLSPGSHRVIANADGFATTQRRIQISSTGDSPERFTVILAAAQRQRASGGVAMRTTRSGGGRYRLWKWIVGSGAVAGVAAGIALVAMDGHGTCSLSPPRTECPDVYNTETAGLVTAGVGIALAAASGWMFYEDRRADRRRVTVAVAPTPGGGAAALLLRF